MGSHLQAPLTEKAAAFWQAYLTRLPADHPQTTDVRLVPFGAVDAGFAAEEGEGDRSLGWWRAAHMKFFGRVVARLGGTLDDTTVIVCERFRLIHPDAAALSPEP